jgi:hypothetical protein
MMSAANCGVVAAKYVEVMNDGRQFEARNLGFIMSCLADIVSTKVPLKLFSPRVKLSFSGHAVVCVLEL